MQRELTNILFKFIFVTKQVSRSQLIAMAQELSVAKVNRISSVNLGINEVHDFTIYNVRIGWISNQFTLATCFTPGRNCVYYIYPITFEINLCTVTINC